MSDPINWTQQRKRLADLTPWPRNPRQIKTPQAKRLLQSVQEFGQVETLAIGPDGEVYNGHQRLNVLMQQYGADYEVDVRVASRPLSEKEREKLTVYLHKGAAGEWDFDVLANEFEIAELVEWGFDAAELGIDLTGGTDNDAEPQIDRAEELRQQWGVEPGQLWRLPSRTPGQEHRLICGDCTDAAVVERVMGGERARLGMTSPPYWVGKDYENENTWDDIVEFIERCAAQLAAACSHRIVINTGAPPAARLTGERAHTRLLLDEWVRELKKHGYLMRYVRIWAKRGGLIHTAPSVDCIDQHWEFVAVFYLPDTYEGQRRLSEKWATDGIWDDFSGEMSSHGHIAAFPIEMPERNIRLYTDEGNLVYEPFSGSGTTIIAAENLSRQCRAVEIAPGYVAVALQRYVDAFGIEPELVN